MWAIFLILGQVWATATAQVTPSADCMLVIRKMWCGLGTALSQRKSVQPSTKIVRVFSSSATGPSAGVLPLEVMPQKKSIFSDSFSRRSSLTLASVPAASSALRSSIFRLPRRPPAALISSAASCGPLNMGSRMFKGQQLAAEEINAAGGLLGRRKIELLKADEAD